MALTGWEILDSLTSAVVAVDREGRVTFFNRALAAQLGIEPGSFLNRPVAELLARMDATLAEGSPRPLQMPSDPQQRTSAVMAFRDREQMLYVREDSSALRDSSGAVMGRLFAYHDITQEKDIDRMKTEFIAVASHELRTPMTSIKGSIDLVLSGFAGEISQETQELLEIAQKSCNRLIRLINNILDLAKIESHQVSFELAPIDLTDVVERAIRSVQAVAAQNHVTLSLRRSQALPPVRADKDRMEQVVTNLLANAIKFSPASGEVTVELNAQDGVVRCSVRDQGCGIAPQDLEKVFGRFQQVGNYRKGGTGLGLAITRALIDEHRGAIWVESKPQQGACFIFQLPEAGGEESTSSASV